MGTIEILQQFSSTCRAQDLSDAEPTFTHMAIAQLFHEKKVKETRKSIL